MEEKERALALVRQMTLREKAALCSGASMFASQPVERLGVPAFQMADGPHGLRKQAGEQDFMGKNGSLPAVCFPAACAVGCGFDPKLAEQMGRALGRACKANDVQLLLGPGVNIKRSPLCGRNFEYFSEDPLLSGTLGAAYVKGVQSEGVGACLKHFFANNQEHRRRTQSSEADERTLREVYLPAFEQVVRQAKPWAVMNSYNKVNGRYVNESPAWCRDLLRKEYGFEGLTVSDWAAVHDRVAALAGGTDLTMPADKAGDGLLVKAVEEGTLDEHLLDEACVRIVETALRTEKSPRTREEYDFDAVHKLARTIATESMVLLKNEGGILPLEESSSIAVLGGFAAAPRYQGAGSSKVNAWRVPTLPEVTAHLPNVTYSEGFGMGGGTDPELLARAVEAARNADTAVIVAGLPPVMEGEGFDRWVMKLPACQNELIEAVCAVQPRTVVVLQNGGVVELPWADRPAAILECYLGGEAVCEALWDVLTGKSAPSGHLAESFPLRLEDNPTYLFWPGEGDRSEYREGVFVGYRYYATREMPVRYPFGHGLTYTEFAFSDLRLSADRFKKGETLRADVTVKNVGGRAGKALVQLYVGAPLGSLGQRLPVRELRAFQKVELAPGESRVVTLELTDRAFSHWDENAHRARVLGGHYTVEVGASAQQVLLSSPVEVEDEYVPDGRRFTIMTPLIEVQRHPAGRAFLEQVWPRVEALIARMGMQGAQNSVPYAELRPRESGLMAEPLQTLQRMLRDLPPEEWETLLRDLNREN
mgnify:CR=1 FL=1